MTREPLLTVGAITAGASAFLALLLAFGVKLSDDQVAAIMGVLAVAAPIIVAVISLRMEER